MDPWEARNLAKQETAQERAETDRAKTGAQPTSAAHDDWAYDKAWQLLCQAQAMRNDAKLMAGLQDWLTRKQHEFAVQRKSLGL